MFHEKTEPFAQLMITAIRTAVHQMYKEKPVTSQVPLIDLLNMHTALYFVSIVNLLIGVPYDIVEEMYNERMKFIRTLAS